MRPPAKPSDTKSRMDWLLGSQVFDYFDATEGHFKESSCALGCAMGSSAHWFAQTLAVLKQRTETPRIKSLHWGRKGAAAILLLGIGVLVGLELRFSWIEARLFAAEASRMSYRLAPGPSGRIRFPDAGPYDLKYGYSRLPAYLDRLRGEGFNTREQARDSQSFLLWSRLGVYPIYQEKNRAGLDIVDERGGSLYSFRDPRRAYEDFDSIPPLVVRTLLFIENRHMLSGTEPDRNPAIDWGRLARAAVDFGLHKVDHHHSVIGGSTLATQLEKLRHSPAGRTHSPAEKLRQITSATLRSYQDGHRTLNAQRAVIRDYINSIPLSSTSGHGEVTGLGDGLVVWYGADFDKVNRQLAAKEDGLTSQQIAERARAYREVLSLFLALRKPSIYLVHNPNALGAETDRYLRAPVEGRCNFAPTSRCRPVRTPFARASAARSAS